MLTIVHKVFTHGTSSKRRDIRKGSWIRSTRQHDDGVLERIVLLEFTDDTSNFGFLLTDRDINTNYVLAFLVDDGVDRNGGLTGLAIANDQFTLPAADRDHGIDGLDTSLQWFM